MQLYLHVWYQNLGHIGGRPVLSPPFHPCFQFILQNINQVAPAEKPLSLKADLKMYHGQWLKCQNCNVYLVLQVSLV